MTDRFAVSKGRLTIRFDDDGTMSLTTYYSDDPIGGHIKQRFSADEVDLLRQILREDSDNE